MTRSEQIAFNAGIAAVVDIAAASAGAIQRKLTEKPTRYNFAHEALVAIVDESNALKLNITPDPSDPTAAMLSGPRPLLPAAAA